MQKPPVTFWTKKSKAVQEEHMDEAGPVQERQLESQAAQVLLPLLAYWEELQADRQALDVD